MITADDLRPGQVYKVGNQGMTITPQTVEVKIHWVGPDTVHYTKDGSQCLRNAPLDHFVKILNESGEKK